MIRVYFPLCCDAGQRGIKADGPRPSATFTMRVGLAFPHDEVIETQEVAYCPFCGRKLSGVQVGWADAPEIPP